MRRWAWSLFYSTILFSPASLIIFDFGGRYLFEIAVVCASLAAFAFRDPVGSDLIRASRSSMRYAIVVACIVLMFMLIGVLRGASWAHAYADFRANMTVVLGFLIGKQLMRRGGAESVIALATTTALTYVVAWFFLFGGAAFENKFPVPLFSAALAALICAAQGRLLQLAAALAALHFLAALGFYRQYWIVCVLIDFAVLISLAAGGFAGWARAGGVISIMFAAAILLAGMLEDFYRSSESLYIQTIGKAEDALRFYRDGIASESDSLRMLYFEFMAANVPSLLLPHGLGYRSNPANFHPWFDKYTQESNTIDSIALYVCYHYGWLLLGCISIWFFVCSIRAIGRWPSVNTVVVFAILIPILFDGGQITVVARAFWFGAFISYLFYFSRRQDGSA